IHGNMAARIGAFEARDDADRKASVTIGIPERHRRGRQGRRTMRARARRTMVVCLASALVIALAAAPAAARPHPGVPEPPQWGDDILPIVHFVEKDRGFHFHHPVKVSLLSRRDFDEQVNSGGPLAGVDPQFRALLTRLGALGLIDSGIRPSDPAFANAGKVLGFYDPRSQEIVVRGADLSNPVTRVITAHELTHALDDQHFSAIEGESQPSIALTSL